MKKVAVAVVVAFIAFVAFINFVPGGAEMVVNAHNAIIDAIASI